MKHPKYIIIMIRADVKSCRVHLYFVHTCARRGVSFKIQRAARSRNLLSGGGGGDARTRRARIILAISGRCRHPPACATSLLVLVKVHLLLYVYTCIPTCTVVKQTSLNFYARRCSCFIHSKLVSVNFNNAPGRL